MWMLLGQVASTCDIDGDSMVSWDESASDISQHWKDLVSLCVEVNPNKRIGLSELTGCWSSLGVNVRLGGAKTFFWKSQFNGFPQS